MKKHLIFDLDGTLLDSMGEWKNLDNAYLKRHNIIPPKDMQERTKTMSLMQSALYFKEELGIADSIKKIMEDITQMIEGKYIHEIPLKEGAKEFLEYERKNGSKMCILTASDRPYVEKALDRLSLTPYFSFLMTCSEEGLSKNSGEIFQKAAAKLGSSSFDTWVLEDSLHAVQSAKKAGFQVVGVYDFSAQEEQKQIMETADRYVFSLKELIQMNF